RGRCRHHGIDGINVISVPEPLAKGGVYMGKAARWRRQGRLGPFVFVSSVFVWRLPWLQRACLRAALDGGSHRRFAVLGHEAACFGGGKQALPDLVLFFAEFTASHELEETKGGNVERIVAPAILGQGGKLATLIPKSGAAVDRASELSCFWCLAVGLADC